MKKYICLLIAAAFLLTGCGGSTPAETEASVTEPSAMTEPTTEPTTVPTEPKTFFEEQGFEFWEGFEVYDTLDEEGNRDGGLFAEANILDSTECKVTIASENREETRYCLADTKVDVWVDEYTLAEFDEECKEKNWGAVNIKNASDSLYKAFKEEDNSLTKEAWLEQYRNYKVIRCQINRQIILSREVENAMLEMNIGQSQWGSNYTARNMFTFVMNSIDGKVYESSINEYPGIADVFSIITENSEVMMALVADYNYEFIKSGNLKDLWFTENFFVMYPAEDEVLTFGLQLVETERTLEDYESTQFETNEGAWEEKSYFEAVEDFDHMKAYFLSPNHH